MERDKSKMKRTNKTKAMHVSDFIALGSKPPSSSRIPSDASESKSSSKVSLSSSTGTSEKKKENLSSLGAPLGMSIKKPKLQSVTSGTTLGRSSYQLKKEQNKYDQWDSVAIEFETPDLLKKISEAEEAHDDEKIEALLCGAVKKLKSSRGKPEASLCLTLMVLANSRHALFCSELTLEAFCSLLRPSSKIKGNTVVPVLAANILMTAYKDEISWPETFVKAFVEDSIGERIWVDLDDCKAFVDNILTAFNTKPTPKNLLFQERPVKTETCPSPTAASVITDDDETSCSSLPLDSQDYQEHIAVFSRYRYIEENLQQYVLDVIHENMARRQPMEISRNTLHFLASTCGISEVRLIVSQKLEMWLQNPKLNRPAQDLLLALCLNCSQHNQQDVEVISSLIKIRIKTKPIINHYLQCMKELLGQHPENLNTVLKHAIYNELSNARNPNNMQLLSVIFQHSPDRAARELAELFQDLLTNREDYLRSLRALLREIVRTLRHDMNFSTFCLGLLQDRRDATFLDLEITLKERVFLSITDLIVLAIFLSISPAVKESYSSLARGEKKDLTSLRNYQLQTATIQRDAVWWHYCVAPKMFKPGKNEFCHSIQKLVFLEQVDHYCNKDNWPTEGERLLLIRMASEVCVFEETLSRLLLIGLSRDHSLNASESLEIADQLVKRAASIYADDFTVLEIENKEIYDLVFNLCAYHHPENISLPQGYHPPSLAITDLYWKAWIMLLIIVCHNPMNFGDCAWKNYPILRSLMEMCITNQFTFPPPTMALGDKADEIIHREMQMNQLEKDQIIQFETHLAAASTKVTITETNSLLLSKVMSMDPKGPARKPPILVLEQLKSANAKLKLGNLLCRSRNPDFLLDIIQSQGTSQSMPWLGELVESSDGSFSMLPVQCLCEFLLNEAVDNSVYCESGDDKEERLGEKTILKRRKKQELLLLHLQTLLHETGSDPGNTVEVIDYFMRRLSSQQSVARNLAVKGLRLVLSHPNQSPESDDEDMLEKSPFGEHGWLLKHMPNLPHFNIVRAQACLCLRQACQIESDPAAVGAYVKFLSTHTPDDNLQQFGDLALDMAQLIVERPTVINTILLIDGSCTGHICDFLSAISEIFFRYLNKAKMPSKEMYSWSESQDHILVQWPSGETATIHILVVHAMVIVLTYGSSEDISNTYFRQLLELWFPSDSDPPQAFLVDTSEEALLLPDWLKLRMIRSSVDSLVDAALKDLDPSQLVLFIQSFGIPVPSMSKLLKTLDLAVEYDSYAVEQAVVDKSYMSQLVEVQHRRGATGGDKFAELLVDSDDTETSMEVESIPTLTHVIQRAPPKLPMAVGVDSVSVSLVKLFGLDQSSGILSAKQEQQLFKGLQKALSHDILNKVSEQGALSHFIHTCEQILQNDLKVNFIQLLHRKSSFSSVLFRLATCRQDDANLRSAVAQRLVWVCEEIFFSSSDTRSPLTTVISQFIKKQKAACGIKGIASWKLCLRQKEPHAIPCDSIVNTIKIAEKQDPVRLEEVVQELIRDAISKGDTKALVAAITKVLLEDSMVVSRSGKYYESKLCLLIDWLERLEPKLIASYPELQCQLLFSLIIKQGKFVPLEFRPYLLAFMTHQADWNTLHYCIKLVLTAKLPSNKYDPTSVLDFLCACIYNPRILQGKDKKTPKHYAEDDVLAINESQIQVVIDYILEEAIMKNLHESESHCVEENSINPFIKYRLHLLMRCIASRRSLINSSVKHLLNMLDKNDNGRMAHELLLHLYLQVPAVIALIPEHVTFLTNTPFSLESASSKLDIISHNLLTSLAATDASKFCAERMTDLELACRKMASSHPVLLLRQMPMIASLLRGRVGFAFSVFRVRNHLCLFSCVLGLLEQLLPYLFKEDCTSSLHNVLESFMDLFQAYGNNKEVIPLLNRFLNLLIQYVIVKPTSASVFIQEYSEILLELSSSFPDLGSFRTLLSGTSLPQWGASGSSLQSNDKDFYTNIAVTQMQSPWSQAQLTSIANKLSQVNSEDILYALQDLDNISIKKPAILEHFVDHIKEFIQESNASFRMPAFNLLVRHLKNKPRNEKQFISAYLQCLESDQRDVVLTALEHLPDFVILAQEHANLLLQKAFIIGMTSNINSSPQIHETIVLLNMQSGC